MLVIGDDEMDQKTISPRKVSGEQLDPMPVSDFVTVLTSELTPVSH